MRRLHSVRRLHSACADPMIWADSAVHWELEAVLVPPSPRDGAQPRTTSPGRTGRWAAGAPGAAYAPAEDATLLPSELGPPAPELVGEYGLTQADPWSVVAGKHTNSSIRARCEAGTGQDQGYVAQEIATQLKPFLRHQRSNEFHGKRTRCGGTPARQ